MKDRVPKMNDESNRLVCRAAGAIGMADPSRRAALSERLVVAIASLRHWANSGPWASAREEVGWIIQEAEKYRWNPQDRD